MEQSIAVGLSVSEVARRHGVSHDSLQRHRNNHMSAEVLAALLTGRSPAQIDFEKLQQTEAEKMLSEVVDQRVRLRQIRDLAVQHGGFGLAIAAENSIRATLELECKLLASVLGPLYEAAAVDAEVIIKIEHVIMPAPPSPDDEIEPARDEAQQCYS